MVVVHIRPSLLQKMEYISNNINVELGAYLTGEVKDGEIYLEEMMIPDQTISGTHVNITPDAQINLRRKYGEKVFKILGHWHSHHKMGCFWSGTDLDNMRNIILNKKFFVFVVSSLSNHLVRVSVRDPINFDLDNVELKINSLEFNGFLNRINSILNTNNYSLDVKNKSTGEFDVKSEKTFLNNEEYMENKNDDEDDEDGDNETVEDKELPYKEPVNYFDEKEKQSGGTYFG